MTPLDASLTNPREGGASFPLKHRLLRLAWGIVWGGLGRWTPAPLHGWRRALLRLFGARLAATAKVYPGVRVWYPPNLKMGEHACLGPRVDCYCMGPISIGPYGLVSQGAHLCGGTHDIDDIHFQLLVKPIEIRTGAWVAADAFVGPGVTVGEGAVVGARAVVMKDVPQLTVVVGNPARVIRHRKAIFESDLTGD